MPMYMKQQKSVKEYREQRECVGDQTDSWDQQQRCGFLNGLMCIHIINY
uniref:Uncharacterized protein n=1 Tax=Heterorhabditis bacteriophora TaxID=37862 RepID=A0A1I7WYS7_HETBA